MASSTVPEQIHRYRVLSELGRGSTGRVYLASDPLIDRRIALKVLAPYRLRGGDSEEVRQRFLQEARAAGGLSHPGIVTVYDTDTDPLSGCPYLAMEWVAGSSLRTLLRRHVRLSTGRAVALVEQVARALDYAHRHGVVHRDVKPANLLIAGDDRVKVVDFGIAKLLSNSVTRPGRVLGSPYYMAPEQVQGQTLDGRSDLFALGSVLYECLTGRKAFRGENVGEVTRKIVTVDPPPIASSSVPVALRRVVGRTLEKLPQNRYQTGAELAAALRELSDEVSPRPPKSPGLRPGRPGESASRSLSASTEIFPLPAAEPPRDVEPPARVVSRGSRVAIRAALILSAGLLIDHGPGSVMPAAQPATTARAVVRQPLGEALRARPLASDPDAGTTSDSAAVQSEISPEVPPAASLPMDATPEPVAAGSLEIVHENRLRLAYLSVWIDGERTFSVKLQAKNPFGRIAGREHRWTIPVPEGRRSVEIHLSGVSKRLEARKKVYEVFEASEPRQLTANLEPGSEELSLVWGGRAPSRPRQGLKIVARGLDPGFAGR